MRRHLSGRPGLASDSNLPIVSDCKACAQARRWRGRKSNSGRIRQGGRLAFPPGMANRPCALRRPSPPPTCPSGPPPPALPLPMRAARRPGPPSPAPAGSRAARVRRRRDEPWRRRCVRASAPWRWHRRALPAPAAARRSMTTGGRPDAAGPGPARQCVGAGRHRGVPHVAVLEWRFMRRRPPHFRQRAAPQEDCRHGLHPVAFGPGRPAPFARRHRSASQRDLQTAGTGASRAGAGDHRPRGGRDPPGRQQDRRAPGPAAWHGLADAAGLSRRERARRRPSQGGRTPAGGFEEKRIVDDAGARRAFQRGCPRPGRMRWKRRFR